MVSFESGLEQRWRDELVRERCDDNDRDSLSTGLRSSRDEVRHSRKSGY